MSGFEILWRNDNLIYYKAIGEYVMKKILGSVLAAVACFALTAADAPKVTVGEGGDAKTYELATYDGAKAYVDA